jgi:hypothetical protein
MSSIPGSPGSRIGMKDQVPYSYPLAINAFIWL